MGETDIVLGILASASTMYGFILAYYVFARTLHFMERDRVEQGQRRAKREDRPDLTDEQYAEEVKRFHHLSMYNIFQRAVLLDGLLLGTTIAFVVTALGSLSYLGTQVFAAPADPLVLVGGAGFIAILAGVVSATLYIGYHNLSYARGEVDHYEKWLKDHGHLSSRKRD